MKYLFIVFCIIQSSANINLADLLYLQNNLWYFDCFYSDKSDILSNIANDIALTILTSKKKKAAASLVNANKLIALMQNL